MTASAMQGDREKCLDDYVSKPVRVEELQAALQRASEIKIRVGDENIHRVDAIDLSALDGLRELENEGNRDFVAALLVLFFRETVERLASLRRAIDAADAVGIESEAHSLKGSSGSLGPMPMSIMCAELEEKGQTGAIEGASETLSRIEEEFGHARAMLEAEISSEVGLLRG